MPKKDNVCIYIYMPKKIMYIFYIAQVIGLSAPMNQNFIDFNLSISR